MKITFISDTHTKHHEMTNDLQGGPILVHCGDVSSRGAKWEVKDFLEWFDSLPYMHKIMIPGNHDFFFDWDRKARTPQGQIRFGNSKIQKEEVDELINQFPNIHILNDSGVTIEGIRFWGSPITPWFHDWAYNRFGNEIEDHWNMIPEGTDILITHGPPYGIKDQVIRGNENVGCQFLLDKIKQIKPKIHAFGHIHEADGIEKVDDTIFINASSLSFRYEYTNPPIVIDYEQA
jgi:predicted phosphodiesterase